MTEQKQNKSLVIVIAAIASTGGLLFGFDTGVISGALPFLKESWDLTTGQQEIVTTAVLVGAVLGSRVEVSPKLSFSPEAIFRNIRRIILPDLVFGNPGTI